MDVKPGWKTTEFWQALGSQLINLFVLLGVVNQTDVSTLNGAVSSAALGVASILTAAWTLVNYIQSRTAVKAVAANNTFPTKQGEPRE